MNDRSGKTLTELLHQGEYGCLYLNLDNHGS